MVITQKSVNIDWVLKTISEVREDELDRLGMVAKLKELSLILTGIGVAWAAFSDPMRIGAIPEDELRTALILLKDSVQGLVDQTIKFDSYLDKEQKEKKKAGMIVV